MIEKKKNKTKTELGNGIKTEYRSRVNKSIVIFEKISFLQINT